MTNAVPPDDAAAIPGLHVDTAGEAARGPRLSTRRNKVRALRWLAVPLVLFVVITIFGPMFYDYDPVAVNVMSRLRPPLTRLADGSMAWLGTDQLGRDILGQLLVGARVSLLVGVSTIVIGGGLERFWVLSPATPARRSTTSSCVLPTSSFRYRPSF